MSKKLESDFNKELKEKLDARFPGNVIINQDPSTSFQGVPDKLVLYKDRWALLESKRATKAARRPNQEHYVEKFNEMSFSAFICPENCDEVLDALQDTFGD